MPAHRKMKGLTRRASHETGKTHKGRSVKGINVYLEEKKEALKVRWTNSCRKIQKGGEKKGKTLEL